MHETQCVRERILGLQVNLEEVMSIDEGILSSPLHI